MKNMLYKAKGALALTLAVSICGAQCVPVFAAEALSAAQQGVRLRGLSEYYLARPERCRADTVVAGYSALKEDDVEKVAQALARAWLS